jgi:hypothetical protein
LVRADGRSFGLIFDMRRAQLSMPITAIWVLADLGMGVLLVMQPQSSVSRWRGRSTVGPSH